MRTSKELVGRDTHRATAAEVFSTHPEAVTTDQRRSAKAINFGMLYGMPITEVQDTVDIMKTLETKKTKELSTLQSKQLNEGEQAMNTEQMINFHMNWGGSSGSSVMKTLETKKTKELIIKRML